MLAALASTYNTMQIISKQTREVLYTLTNASDAKILVFWGGERENPNYFVVQILYRPPSPNLSFPLFFQTYARFTGAPLKVHKITNPWRSPSGNKIPIFPGSDWSMELPDTCIFKCPGEKADPTVFRGEF